MSHAARIGIALGLALLVGLSVVAAAPAWGGEGDAPPPQTAGDPEVAVTELDLRLQPLRKDQLQSEAEAWAALVEAKAGEIASLRVRIGQAEGEAKDKLLEELPALQEQRKELVERLQTVLDAWTAKGGDAGELLTWLDEVTGVEVDLSDTAAVWSMLVNWVESPDGGVTVGRNIVFFLLILLAARILANLLGGIVRRALGRIGRTPELLRKFLTNSVRNVTFFVGLVVALSVLGLDIGPFMAAIGAAGFVVAFALQGTLSNFANGVMILLYRPFDVGHFVNVAGVAGTVEALSLVSTRIKTPDNQVVVVPNSQIWGNVITNVTGSETRRVDMVFGIGYDDDLQKAQTVLEDILQKHPLVLDDPAPVVGVKELAASSVSFNVRPWVKTSDYWTVYGDVTRTVKQRFDEEGISIPYPQQEVHMRQVTAS